MTLGFEDTPHGFEDTTLIPTGTLLAFMISR